MVEGAGPFQSSPRFEGSGGSGGSDDQGSGEQDPERVPGMAQVSGMNPTQLIVDECPHNGRTDQTKVRRYETTSYCPLCDGSKGVDGFWRGDTSVAPPRTSEGAVACHCGHTRRFHPDRCRVCQCEGFRDASIPLPKRQRTSLG